MSFKKIFSTAVAAVFTWSVIGSDLSYALSLNPAQVALSVTSAEIYDASFKNFAKLTSSADFGGDTAVINIQDLHMSTEVQKNISSVIDILVNDYGVENVYVEGGYGKINTDIISNIKDEDLRKNIALGLLDSALITGTEYYSAINDKKDFLIGLENENVHKENIKRLGTILDKKPLYEKAMADLKNELEFFQKKYFSRENIKLSKLIAKYGDGRISSLKYYSALLNYLKKNSAQSQGYYGTVMPLDMNDYPNICMFLYILQISQNLNYKAVNKELAAFVESMKENLPYAQYNEIVKQTNNFQEIQPLIEYIKRHNLEVSGDNLVKFIEFNEKSKQINPVKMVTE
ncbi:MAG: hypothetical protein LBQ47_02685, partial [Endomicrobium sp.]|nr:hypothetical protein [Endomicrobium sp.]